MAAYSQPRNAHHMAMKRVIRATNIKTSHTQRRTYLSDKYEPRITKRQAIDSYNANANAPTPQRIRPTSYVNQYNSTRRLVAALTGGTAGDKLHACANTGRTQHIPYVDDGTRITGEIEHEHKQRHSARRANYTTGKAKRHTRIILVQKSRGNGAYRYIQHGHGEIIEHSIYGQRFYTIGDVVVKILKPGVDIAQIKVGTAGSVTVPPESTATIITIR